MIGQANVSIIGSLKKLDFKETKNGKKYAVAYVEFNEWTKKGQEPIQNKMAMVFWGVQADVLRTKARIGYIICTNGLLRSKPKSDDASKNELHFIPRTLMIFKSADTVATHTASVAEKEEKEIKETAEAAEKAEELEKAKVEEPQIEDDEDEDLPF